MPPTTAIEAEVESWRRSIASMSREHTRLRSEGRWTSGPAELVAVLGLHHDEVRNCRVIRWLLDPEAPHGLGTRMLGRLLERLGTEASAGELASASVETEIGRDATRADLVIRVGDLLVVVEAKTFAPEGVRGSGQCAELERSWGDQDPTFVFLTRHRQAPTTTTRPDRWKLLGWSDLADDLGAELVATAGSQSPGWPAAAEYARALRKYLS